MHIMIIDDDKALARSLQIHLTQAGHDVGKAMLGKEGLEVLRNEDFDLVFVDLDLPDMSGLDILRTVEREHQRLLPVMITGLQDAKATIEAIRLGAFDYIRKPLDLDAVLVTVEKASRHFAQRGPRRTEEAVVPFAGRAHEIVGAHPTIIDVLKQVALVSKSAVPVLIQGETGTGKELVARSLHEASRPDSPFVAVNCSAVVATLLESELFGHEKGAFTGAESDKQGKLEAAGEGTVFFDEIGDMAPELQAKLLRVLQEREFERVGSTKTRAFRARVIAATHRDLKGMVARSAFREDLYYRLTVTTITVPPLRERRTDIPILCEHVLGRLAEELHKDVRSIDRKALERCIAYDWPGNIRELNNVLTRAVLLARNSVITDELIAVSMGRADHSGALTEMDIRPLAEIERDYV